MAEITTTAPEEDEPSRESSDNKVGYGMPPKHTQFKRGTSGNPRGRPKHQMSLAELIEVQLGTHVTIKDQGKTIRPTKRELIAISLVNAAAKGNVRALKVMQELMATLPPRETDEPDTDFHFTMRLEEDDTGPTSWETDREGNVVSINQPPPWMRPKQGRL